MADLYGINYDNTTSWYDKYKIQTPLNLGSYITIPFSGQLSAEPVSLTLTPGQLSAEQTSLKLTPEGNIPFTSNNPTSTGLSIEKTATQANQTQSQEQTQPQTEQTQKQPTTLIKDCFDEQTMEWFGYDKSPEKRKEWAALSLEEKQQKSIIALKGMIKAYNDDQRKKGSNKRMTVADQYKIFISRCSTEEEVRRLTYTVKAMDRRDQLFAFKNSYQYQSEEFRDIAEGILAVDYTKLDKSNVLDAAKETRNFSPQNQVIAAENAPNADVSLHQDLVNEFTSRKNEQIDEALAGKVGEFGVTRDEAGNVISTNKEIQLGCFTKIVDEANKEGFSKAIVKAADNAWTLHKDNQAKAVQCIVDTGCKPAIEAAANNWSKYDTTIPKEGEGIQTSAQTQVEGIIMSSGYDSAKQVLLESKVKAEFTAKVYAASPEKAQLTSPTISQNKSTEETLAKVDEMLKNNPSPALILNEIKNLSAVAKLSLLKKYPNNANVVNALFASGLSSALLSELSIEGLKEIGYKNFVGPQICLLNPEAQKFILDICAQNGTLSDIPEYSVVLNEDVKAKYKELKEKTKKLNSFLNIIGNR